MLRLNKKFANLLKATYERHPCSPDDPWQLCLYNDEAKPGSGLKQFNRRAMACLYMSILDFLPPALSKEEFWLTVAAVRSSIAHVCDAGMAQLMGGILKKMFSGAAS